MTNGGNGGIHGKPVVLTGALASLKLTPVDPHETLKLGSKSARLEHAPPHEAILTATGALLERLAALQEAFHADRSQALLLVLQGRDASGKDGVIKTVYGAFNPTGVSVAAFGPPTSYEREHDFLWRAHQKVPVRGAIGVFNRSHYEDVLAVRVRELVPESVWRPRYRQINAFEQMLSENSIIIRKCFLHVSQDEQAVRLRERLEDPRKNWKFRLEDLEDRARWDAYTDAYRDALRECSTKHAPWYVVPADDKVVRNFLIARLLVDTLEAVHPRYPLMDPAVRAAAAGFR
jgi:PPK2 family polyphosphate:nucleotide phosphotransferase